MRPFVWAAAAVAAVAVGPVPTDAGIYDDAYRLVSRHGFLHPAPTGSGWETFEVTELAVSSVYAWAPTTKSPPQLTTKTHTAGDPKLIDCGTELCVLDTDKLATETVDAAFTSVLKELLTSYGANAAGVGPTAVPDGPFTELAGETARGCASNDQCIARFGEDSSCCDSSATLPGICCVRASLNQYDATVPDWIIFFFLAGAGFLLYGPARPRRPRPAPPTDTAPPVTRLGWLVNTYDLLRRFTAR